MLKRACLALWCLFLVVAFCAPAGATTTYYFDMDSDQNHPGTFYTQTGYTSVEVDTLYTPTLKYGWVTSPLTNRDRGPITGNPLSDLLRDLQFNSEDRTFKAGFGSGQYEVTLYLCDTSYIHDNIQVFAENGSTPVATVGSVGSTAVIKNFTVSVTDGDLDLRFHDAGGSDPNWIINGIVISYVPLPSTLLLLSSGMLGLLAWRRRRQQY